MSTAGRNSSTTTKDSSGTPTVDAMEKAAIDQFKRSGDFDAVRKDTLRRWEASDDGSAFRKKLRAIVEAEVARDRSLLARDRGKAATLVGGAVERTNLYQETRIAAAKNIFQSAAFKQHIYETLKKYIPDAKQEPKDKQNGEKVSAQEAAHAFIEREGGT